MNTKTPIEEAELNQINFNKYRIKYRSILFGSMSLIMMAFAIIFYENQFNLFGQYLPTVLIYEGTIVNDSFLFFILFGFLSILLSVTGIIYAIKNRKITGFLLSLIVFAGICFISHKSNTTLPETITKFSIQDRSEIVEKVVDTNSTESNQTI